MSACCVQTQSIGRAEEDGALTDRIGSDVEDRMIPKRIILIVDLQPLDILIFDRLADVAAVARGLPVGGVVVALVMLGMRTRATPF